MFKVKNKTLMLVSMLVSYVPIVVFLFTWCNLMIAIIGTASVGYGFYRFLKDIDGEF